VDGAVALVQTYLRVNGYFTVTEFPLVECVEGTEYRTATDIDLLACRFPAASQMIVGQQDKATAKPAVAPDPALDIPEGVVDMIVGEVKESAATFNRAGLREDVLAAALARFGCCQGGGQADHVAATLLSVGEATTHAGHRVRLVAFGTRIQETARYKQVGLDTVIRYLEAYVREHWDVLKMMQSKDDPLAFLILKEKARRAESGRMSRSSA